MPTCLSVRPLPLHTLLSRAQSLPSLAPVLCKSFLDSSTSQHVRHAFLVRFRQLRDEFEHRGYLIFRNHHGAVLCRIEHHYISLYRVGFCQLYRALTFILRKLQSITARSAKGGLIVILGSE